VSLGVKDVENEC